MSRHTLLLKNNTGSYAMTSYRFSTIYFYYRHIRFASTFFKKVVDMQITRYIISDIEQMIFIKCLIRGEWTGGAKNKVYERTDHRCGVWNCKDGRNRFNYYLFLKSFCQANAISASFSLATWKTYSSLFHSMIRSVLITFENPKTFLMVSFLIGILPANPTTFKSAFWGSII